MNKAIMKISSSKALMKEHSEIKNSINISQESQILGEVSRIGKMKVLKKYSKAGKNTQGSLLRKSHDGIPTISISQVKKPLYGIKSGVINEYSN